MTLEELYKLLKTLGRPVAYDHFDDAPELPFMAFIDSGKTRFIADGRVLTSAINIRLEIYFDKTRDIEFERKVEELLDNNGILFTDDPTEYIASERMYEHRYFFKI